MRDFVRQNYIGGFPSVENTSDIPAKRGSSLWQKLTRLIQLWQTKHYLPQRFSPQVLLGSLGFFVLALGGVAAFVLVGRPQELRQQAAGIDNCCGQTDYRGGANCTNDQEWLEGWQACNNKQCGVCAGGSSTQTAGSTGSTSQTNTRTTSGRTCNSPTCCQFWCGGCGGFCGDTGVYDRQQTCDVQIENKCGQKPCYETGTCDTCRSGIDDWRCSGSTRQYCSTDNVWVTYQTDSKECGGTGAGVAGGGGTGGPVATSCDSPVGSIKSGESKDGACGASSCVKSQKVRYLCVAGKLEQRCVTSNECELTCSDFKTNLECGYAKGCAWNQVKGTCVATSTLPTDSEGNLTATSTSSLKCPTGSDPNPKGAGCICANAITGTAVNFTATTLPSACKPLEIDENNSIVLSSTGACSSSSRYVDFPSASACSSTCGPLYSGSCTPDTKSVKRCCEIGTSTGAAGGGVNNQLPITNEPEPTSTPMPATAKEIASCTSLGTGLDCRNAAVAVSGAVFCKDPTNNAEINCCPSGERVDEQNGNHCVPIGIELEDQGVAQLPITNEPEPTSTPIPATAKEIASCASLGPSLDCRNAAIAISGSIVCRDPNNEAEAHCCPSGLAVTDINGQLRCSVKTQGNEMFAGSYVDAAQRCGAFEPTQYLAGGFYYQCNINAGETCNDTRCQCVNGPYQGRFVNQGKQCPKDTGINRLAVGIGNFIKDVVTPPQSSGQAERISLGKRIIDAIPPSVKNTVGRIVDTLVNIGRTVPETEPENVGEGNEPEGEPASIDQGGDAEQIKENQAKQREAQDAARRCNEKGLEPVQGLDAVWRCKCAIDSQEVISLSSPVTDCSQANSGEMPINAEYCYQRVQSACNYASVVPDSGKCPAGTMLYDDCINDLNQTRSEVTCYYPSEIGGIRTCSSAKLTVDLAFDVNEQCRIATEKEAAFTEDARCRAYVAGGQEAAVSCAEETTPINDSGTWHCVCPNSTNERIDPGEPLSNCSGVGEVVPNWQDLPEVQIGQECGPENTDGCYVSQSDGGKLLVPPGHAYYFDPEAACVLKEGDVASSQMQTNLNKMEYVDEDVCKNGAQVATDGQRGFLQRAFTAAQETLSPIITTLRNFSFTGGSRTVEENQREAGQSPTITATVGSDETINEQIRQCPPNSIAVSKDETSCSCYGRFSENENYDDVIFLSKNVNGLNDNLDCVATSKAEYDNSVRAAGKTVFSGLGTILREPLNTVGNTIQATIDFVVNIFPGSSEITPKEPIRIERSPRIYTNDPDPNPEPNQLLDLSVNPADGSVNYYVPEGNWVIKKVDTDGNETDITNDLSYNNFNTFYPGEGRIVGVYTGTNGGAVEGQLLFLDANTVAFRDYDYRTYFLPTDRSIEIGVVQWDSEGNFPIQDVVWGTGQSGPAAECQIGTTTYGSHDPVVEMIFPSLSTSLENPQTHHCYTVVRLTN